MLSTKLREGASRMSSTGDKLKCCLTLPLFFCAAADPRGIVGQKFSYLLKRHCNNRKRPGSKVQPNKKNNTPKQPKTNTRCV